MIFLPFNQGQMLSQYIKTIFVENTKSKEDFLFRLRVNQVFEPQICWLLIILQLSSVYHQFMFYIFFYVHLEYKLLTLGAPLHRVQHIGFGHRRAADQILAGTINFIIPLVGSPEVNPLAVMLLDNRLYISTFQN